MELKTSKDYTSINFKQFVFHLDELEMSKLYNVLQQITGGATITKPFEGPTTGSLSQGPVRHEDFVEELKTKIMSSDFGYSESRVKVLEQLKELEWKLRR